MSGFRESVRAKLLADTALTLSVSTRIYPNKLPQRPVIPSIVIQVITGMTIHSQSGSSSLELGVIQVTAWSKTSVEASRIAREIEAALDGLTWTLGGVNVQRCFKVRETDIEPLEGTMLYGVAQDYETHHI